MQHFPQTFAICQNPTQSAKNYFNDISDIGRVLYLKYYNRLFQKLDALPLKKMRESQKITHFFHWKFPKM